MGGIAGRRSDPGDFWVQLARYNNAHRAEVESTKQFANGIAYGVGYPAAGAVAAPVVGAGLLYGTNVYLTNPNRTIGVRHQILTEAE
jgi:hypothetical protein